MAFARLGRVGTFVLALWLTADAAAYGLCKTSALSHESSSDACIGAVTHDSPDAAPVCGGAHHCFCCSASTEMVAFALTVDACAACMTPSLQLTPSDSSVSNTSPPPRF